MLFSPFQPTPFFFGSRFLHRRELSVASTAPPISSFIGGTVLLFLRAQNTDVSRDSYSITSSAEMSAALPQVSAIRLPAPLPLATELSLERALQRIQP